MPATRISRARELRHADQRLDVAQVLAAGASPLSHHLLERADRRRAPRRRACPRRSRSSATPRPARSSSPCPVNATSVERPSPSTCASTAISSPQSGFEPSAWRLCASRWPLAPRAAVVVEDDVAVELVEHGSGVEPPLAPGSRKNRAASAIASTSASTSSCRVVDVERGARRRRHVERRHHRLRAVVPGANRHAVTIEDLPDVVRVHAFEVERDHAAALLRVRRPEQRHARHVAQAVAARSRASSTSCARTCSMPSAVEVVDRRAEARSRPRCSACPPRTGTEIRSRSTPRA